MRELISWRAVGLRLFDRPSLIGLAVGLVRFAQAVRGERFARALLDRFGAVFVWSGWPYEPGYVHLHASRFYWRVARRVWGGEQVPLRTPAPRAGRPLRVGVFANLDRTLATQKPLFDALPSESIELHLFDRLSGGAGATYLRVQAAAYHPLETDDVARIAQLVNAAQLDLLLNIVSKTIPYDLFDRLDVPCIVQVCTESDLVHHPKVGFHLYPQPECGYCVRDGRVFCTFTKRPFGDQRVFESSLVIDTRDLNTGERRGWRSREPLIAWHGTLYKLCAPAFLDGIFQLLADDTDLRFEFFGRDVGDALARISRTAKSRGVGDRVHYGGVATFGRDRTGRVIADGFSPLASVLSRARLWPDSFPVGGSAARFEAYTSGVPSIHMAPRTPNGGDGPCAEGSLLELPWLRAPLSVATSFQNYFDLARRCLYEESFADQLVAEQDAVVARVSDARGWWQHVLRCYEQWESEAGVSRTLGPLTAPNGATEPALECLEAVPPLA
jgi:hypothetical protein